MGTKVILKTKLPHRRPRQCHNVCAGVVNPVRRIESSRHHIGRLPDYADIFTILCNSHKRKSYLNRLRHPADMFRRFYICFAAAGLIAEIFYTCEQALVFSFTERAETRENRQPRNVDNVPVFIYFYLGFYYKCPFLFCRPYDFLNLPLCPPAVFNNRLTSKFVCQLTLKCNLRVFKIEPFRTLVQHYPEQFTLVSRSHFRVAHFKNEIPPSASVMFKF